MVSSLPRDLRLAVNTQTPLVRFREGTLAGDQATALSQLTQGEHYKTTTGGVVRMLLPLMQRWRDGSVVRDVAWIAMGSDADERLLRHEGLDLAFVGMPEKEKRGYALVKERMWALLNSNPSTPAPYGAGGIPEEAWTAFDAYQRHSAEAIAAAGARMGGLDLVYVHDFQQLGVAQAWPSSSRPPMVFHLHTPFPSLLPAGWADYFVARLRRYDAVIVSTRRYADNLRAAGLDTPVHVIHPFIDPESYPRASSVDGAQFRKRFGIAPDDRIVLNVGRMDPMKGQDRLIRALPRVLASEPGARLVLVGNGSFSSSKTGGLGLDKGKTWRAHLEALADELAVLDRVTFTGHLGDDMIPAAYGECDVFALPSTREGFGLAVIEAWRQQKPVVVSDRAGVAELVVDGVNGVRVDCADETMLADAIARILAAPDEALAMGRAGLIASQAATMEVGRQALEAVFASVLEERPHAIA